MLKSTLSTGPCREVLFFETHFIGRERSYVQGSDVSCGKHRLLLKTERPRPPTKVQGAESNNSAAPRSGPRAHTLPAAWPMLHLPPATAQLRVPGNTAQSKTDQMLHSLLRHQHIYLTRQRTILQEGCLWKTHSYCYKTTPLPKP
jgi:hypothetical protein